MMYDCWKHGIQAGDHCPHCTVHFVMPAQPQERDSEFESERTEQGEQLANASYRPHRFGDCPAWFDTSCRLATRALRAESELAVLRAALKEAAMSLATIASQAGRDEFLTDMIQIKGYALSRSIAAEAALPAVRDLEGK